MKQLDSQDTDRPRIGGGFFILIFIRHLVEPLSLWQYSLLIHIYPDVRILTSYQKGGNDEDQDIVFIRNLGGLVISEQYFDNHLEGRILI